MDFASKRKKPAYNTIANRSLKYIDYPVFFIVAILLMLGLVSLFSASALYAANKGLDSLFYTKKQALYILFGLGLMAAAKNKPGRIRPYCRSYSDHRPADRNVHAARGHVRRWIPLGFMRPDEEFAKVVLVLYLADFDRSISRIRPTGGTAEAAGRDGAHPGSVPPSRTLRRRCF